MPSQATDTAWTAATFSARTPYSMTVFEVVVAVTVEDVEVVFVTDEDVEVVLLRLRDLVTWGLGWLPWL